MTSNGRRITIELVDPSLKTQFKVERKRPSKAFKLMLTHAYNMGYIDRADILNWFVNTELFKKKPFLDSSKSMYVDKVLTR